MVFMRMGKDDGIKMFYFFTQHLVPKIGSRINHQSCFCRFHHDAGAKPLIFFIWRSADLAIATDHRHTATGTRAEKCYCKRWIRHRSNLLESYKLLRPLLLINQFQKIVPLKISSNLFAIFLSLNIFDSPIFIPRFCPEKYSNSIVWELRKRGVIRITLSQFSYELL